MIVPDRLPCWCRLKIYEVILPPPARRGVPFYGKIREENLKGDLRERATGLLRTRRGGTQPTAILLSRSTLPRLDQLSRIRVQQY
eukprot:scaffold11036_cov68-Cyclotella_meneghiniana.AAC.3